MPKGFEQADLTGELIHLRPIQAGDAEAAFALLQDDRIISQIDWDGPASVEELTQSYTHQAHRFRLGEAYHFAIEGVEGLGIKGAIGLGFYENPLHADVGYWLGIVRQAGLHLFHR